MVEYCYAKSFMLSVIFTVCRIRVLYANCHYAECSYAECHGAKYNLIVEYENKGLIMKCVVLKLSKLKVEFKKSLPFTEILINVMSVNQ
jgi:hypothetical protein